MSVIKNLSRKYNNLCKDTNLFKTDYRNRKKSDIISNIEYTETEKNYFKNKLQSIIENTKMKRIEKLVRGKEYANKKLLVLSSIFSILGVLLTNGYIVNNKSGLHINFSLYSITTIVCLLVTSTFYFIMDLTYKHFFNIPTLFSSFDITPERKINKIINVISLCICFLIFGFSMATNTIAFLSFGVNWITSLFCGIGIDLMNILATWYKNKFTSLDGYNDITNDITNKSNVLSDNTNDITAKEIINNLINNTQTGDTISYNYKKHNFSSNYFYQQLNKDDRVEKRNGKYYKIG